MAKNERRKKKREQPRVAAAEAARAAGDGAAAIDESQADAALETGARTAAAAEPPPAVAAEPPPAAAAEPPPAVAAEPPRAADRPPPRWPSGPLGSGGGLGIAGTAPRPLRGAGASERALATVRRVERNGAAAAAPARVAPADRAGLRPPVASPPRPSEPAPARPVVKVSLSQAAAAGGQELRRLSPVARPVATRIAPSAREERAPERRREKPAPARPLRIPDPAARRIAVSGLGSPACVARVERALRAVPGVTEAEANLAAGVVAVGPAGADEAAIAAALAAAGHAPRGAAPSAAAARSSARRLALLSLVTLGVAAGAGVARALGAGQLGSAAIAAASLGTAWAALGPGLRHALRLRPSAELLPALATLVLLISGAIATDAPVHLAPLPLAIHLAGLALAARCRSAALGRVERVRALLPEDGEGSRAGERVVVAAGRVLPADGRLLSRALLDERALGGEDEVERLPGELVCAGASARSEVELVVLEPAARSRLRRCLAVAERALSTHPTKTLAQRAATAAIPVALGIAVAAGALGGAWTAGVVLAAAAPLAVGLAASLASVAAVTRAAERGVAVRSAEALERAGLARVAVFDKSSLLSRGDAAVLELLPRTGHRALELLPLLAAAEAGVDHPIARAIAQHAADLRVVVPNATAVEHEPGLGVRATVGGREVRLGSLHHLSRAGVDVAPLAGAAEELARRGRTPVVAAIDGAAVAVLGVADTPRESARQALGSLELLEMDVRIVTGDATAAVQHLAVGMGLDRRAVRGDLDPAEKRACVEEARADGLCLVATGSGVDLGALAAADLPVAAAGDPAVEGGAGALLVRPDPLGVVELLRAGRAARRARALATAAGLAGNAAAIGLAAAGVIGLGGAAALAAATTLATAGAAASPWIRIR